jgi:hypothetical protein
MEHIDGSISVGMAALFGISKAVGVTRSEPSPVRLRKKDTTIVLEVGMSHTLGTLTHVTTVR